jgi:CubicO group peptidase (beta-lactamase class C family)
MTRKRIMSSSRIARIGLLLGMLLASAAARTATPLPAAAPDTSDHLGTNIRNNAPSLEPHREGYGFGLSVQVRVHNGMAATPGSIGDYSWNGANGTAFWADPAERLVVVRGAVTPGAIRKYYREQLGALVYGAMYPLPDSKREH